MCHHFPHPPVIVPNPCDWVQGISSHLQWTIYHCNQIIMRAEIKNQTSLCYERIIQICCVNWILSVYLNYKSEITSKQILSWTLIMKPANQQFSVNLNYILVCSYKALECLQKTSNILLCFTEERSLFSGWEQHEGEQHNDRIFISQINVCFWMFIINKHKKLKHWNLCFWEQDFQHHIW